MGQKRLSDLSIQSVETEKFEKLKSSSGMNEWNLTTQIIFEKFHNISEVIIESDKYILLKQVFLFISQPSPKAFLNRSHLELATPLVKKSFFKLLCWYRYNFKKT